MTLIKVRDVAIGDKLDLEQDAVANGPCTFEQTTGEPCPDRRENGHSITWVYEYGIVDEVTRETPGCVVLEFGNGSAVGFPPDHVVTLATD